MLLIPNTLLARYSDFLGKRGVPASRFAEYKKWLRYYLDFCDKYPVPEAKSERVKMFNGKLSEKKQTPAQLKTQPVGEAGFFLRVLLNTPPFLRDGLNITKPDTRKGPILQNGMPCWKPWRPRSRYGTIPAGP
jgi:hypothetical protein